MITAPPELTTPSDPVSEPDGTITAPVWFIALFGSLLVLSGIVYFVLRARRSSLKAGR